VRRQSKTRTILHDQDDGNRSHGRPENSILRVGRHDVRGSKKMNKGKAIKAKIQAEIGTIAHLSIIGVGILGRPMLGF
jgi:hypothetical protein